MWADIVQRLKAAEQRMIDLRREHIEIEADAARLISDTVRKVTRQLYLAKLDKAEKKEPN